MRDETNKQIHRPSCLVLSGGVISLPTLANFNDNNPNHIMMQQQYGLDCNRRLDGCQNQSGSTHQGTVIHIPNQKWINYHGALASNGKGNVGKSENARSERAAKREALKQCGAKDCRIRAYVRNGCLAAAFDGQGSGVGAADTREEAEQRAMNHCQADGSTCVINYSHCNHPVRIK